MADGLTPHYLPVKLHRIIQNATQIFHIDKRKPSDVELSYIVGESDDMVAAASSSRYYVEML
ncbi:hypothetical protein AZE42_01967 [Rhizopogon vesiculosus]|uniref:RNA polymerase Rpb1 domain-containing protein n=1 Tax=Rhizopogon vesiculosus TaxID=180088 RepID=A0A1J8RFG1_9AGAM|nr:hypothetical protein AZE42_01967 [Rhizopogon vesiculosus]